MKEDSKSSVNQHCFTKLTYMWYIHICSCIHFNLKQNAQDHVITLEPGLPQDKADSQNVAPEFRGSAKQQERRSRSSKIIFYLLRGFVTVVGEAGRCVDAQARITGGQVGALG